MAKQEGITEELKQKDQNDLNRNDEQLQDDSRGTDNERTNLQLEILTEEEQNKQKYSRGRRKCFCFSLLKK